MTSHWSDPSLATDGGGVAPATARRHSLLTPADLECPAAARPADFVSLIREQFYTNCWEAEFMCACDVSKVFPPSLQQLNDAQVNVMHVPATSKNAADEKVKQSLRRFSDQYPAPATVLLITGDMNFAPDLTFLKHRKKHRVILIHNRQARPALLNCADERHQFDDLLARLPDVRQQESRGGDRLCCHLRLTGLPSGGAGRKSKVVNEIQKLVYNCGGRVERVNLTAGDAIIVFSVAWQRRQRTSYVFVPAWFGGGWARRYRQTYPRVLVRVRRWAKHRLHHVVICGSQTFVQFHYKTGQRSRPSRLSSSGEVAMVQESGPLSAEGRPPATGPPLWSPAPRTRSSSVSTQTSPEPGGGSPAVGGPGGLDGPVELTVTNLDASRHPRDAEKVLYDLAIRHAKVESVLVYCQSDGSLVGTISVPTLYDSQALIAEMHRAVVGTKRIMLAYARTDRPDPYKIRTQVIRLLNDVPSGQLPLVKFMELYEQRFHNTVSIADLFRMRETVTVVDSSSGRVIQLNPMLKTQDHGCGVRPPAASACARHPPQRGATVGWAELDDPSVLPNSDVALEELERVVRHLLETHDGLLHLSSLLDCYAAEFHDPALARLRLDPAAVCLEHLITCLADVRVVTRGQDKLVVWARDSPEDEPAPVNPSLQQKVVLFSREVVDLLRAAPRARMPFNRFIPAYHHHFGRQCRVSDYGFTRLADLFDVLPQIVQVLVLGCGHRRVITLTPRAQERRFLSDLLRVLKAAALEAAWP
ncbi:meiosis regulator and mRNA stability factor 1-like [Pollicipes pollicipes]|uniref:meiosis regulator and mRNA stability factor 1-like n=1 Tax=Pollicipes pollicipes TaxID=41117 RepID=UPI0018852205|nr:meiosis regulator and mRNA stability factor 1-like [Pollicipes pollicipes]